MKDLIKKILKEETSDFKPALIKAFYSFMEIEMEGYEIYVDTPENRFEYTPESIWIVNPKTKRWMIELKKSGKLLYYYGVYDNFLMWFKEEFSVFEQLISMWVDDVLRRGVSITTPGEGTRIFAVEDVVNKGIKIS